MHHISLMNGLFLSERSYDIFISYNTYACTHTEIDKVPVLTDSLDFTGRGKFHTCIKINVNLMELGPWQCTAVSVPVHLGGFHCLDIEMEWTESTQAHFKESLQK